MSGVIPPPWTRHQEEHQLHLDHATKLFRRHFKLAYYRFARRYHPDLNRNGHELMANINAARAAILKARQFDR